MEYYFITGVSKGIGEALAKNVIQRKGAFVFGISRHNTITGANFHFVPLDLSDIASVQQFDFPECDGATKIVLVNNAGALGTVNHAGKLNNEMIGGVMNLDLIAPAILVNKFLGAFGHRNIPLVIMNISSGAAKNPIDGWATYCASKAGLEMFSRVVAEELAISGKNHIRIFSVAPGVVDTGMQDQIRTSPSENFSRIQQFIDYKATGQLADPAIVAAKLLSILDLPEKYAETAFSVKDINIVNQHTNQ